MARNKSKRLNAWALATALLAVVSATVATASFHYHFLPNYDAGLHDFNAQQLALAARDIEKRQAEEAYAAYLEKYEDEDQRLESIRAKWGEVVDRLTVPARTVGPSLPSNVSGDEFGRTAEHENAAADSHWSFQPLRKPELPKIADTRWPTNGIDYFILEGLESAGLTPARKADAPTIIRRLFFDVLGVPPDEFVEQRESGEMIPEDYYPELVELVLNDPYFGEHWARYWLDVARYADSNGYEEDEIREDAYPYRDFVIWSMNNDLPFDQFIQWQVAGDQIAPNHPLAVAATGFCTAGSINTFMPQPNERMDELDDIVGTLFSATLGLSVRCARCHDHMYDPITSKEYYQLVSIFKNTKRDKAFLVEDQGAAYREYYDPLKHLEDEVKAIRYRSLKELRIAALEQFTEEERNVLRQPLDPNDEKQLRLLSLCKRCLLIQDYMLTDDVEPLPEDQERHDVLASAISEIREAMPDSPPVGLVITGGEFIKTPLLNHGLLEHEGELVGPGFLQAVSHARVAWNPDTWMRWKPAPDALPRTALAFWLTDTQDGAGNLLARVIVNRLWQWHFGRGLVATPNDYGLLGDAPSHPALLEWLATELVENNWSLKHIHRLIVTSSTYQQSAHASPNNFTSDPLNKLVSRYPVRRLTAEMIRDAALTACGEMNLFMYGPGIRLPHPHETIYTSDPSAEEWPTECEFTRPSTRCRTIYTIHRRTSPNPFLQAFDAPDAGFSCDRRLSSVVPTQSLALLNSAEMYDLSKLFAQRVLKRCQVEDWNAESCSEIVRNAYQLAFGRYPHPFEIEVGTRYLLLGVEEQVQLERTAPQEAMEHCLTDYCHSLFLTNEFIHYY